MDKQISIQKDISILQMDQASLDKAVCSLEKKPEVDRSLAKLEAKLKQVEVLQITVMLLQATVNAQSEARWSRRQGPP